MVELKVYIDQLPETLAGELPEICGDRGEKLLGKF